MWIDVERERRHRAGLVRALRPGPPRRRAWTWRATTTWAWPGTRR
ncbi:hypothetical protein NKH77_07170 [Streptomyces sp. M19]